MTEFQKYIQRYLDLIPNENWVNEMKVSGEKTMGFYQTLTEETSHFAYTEGKWTLKEMLLHLTDAEKIFQYRALRFARKDHTELAGFDEDLFAANCNANSRSLESLMEEFETVRKVSLLFFETLTAEGLSQKGKANGNEISVETLGRLIVGHNYHHLKVIEERYLPKM